MRPPSMTVIGRLAVCIASSALLVSCADNGVSPQSHPPSQMVLAFIQAQSLPLLRSSENCFRVDPVVVFGVSYGRPHDCPAGCAYSGAYGLRSGTRVGWLRVYGAGGYEPDSSSCFDVAGADSVVCGADLWARMQATESYSSWFRQALLPVFARDPDTDPRALLRISEMLYSYISPHVAWCLLENDYVQHDVGVLSRLVSLPVFQGDTYALPRSRAAELLKELD